MITSKATLAAPKLISKGDRHTVTWSVGRKVRKRTFDNLAHAERQLKQCERLVAAGAPEILLASPKAAQVFTLFYQRFGEKKMLEILELSSADIEFVGLQDSIDRYISELGRAGRSQSHIFTVRSHMASLSDAAGAVDVSEVTDEHIRTVLGYYESAKTKSNILVTYRAFFRYAIKQQWCTKSPADTVMAPRVIRSVPEIFTPDEMRATLDAATVEAQAFLVLGGFCGLRSAEVLRVEWEDLRGGALVLSSAITKTARRRSVALEQNAQAWIGQIAAYACGEQGTARLNRIVHLKERDLRAQLKQACDVAGVTWKHNALRHSYASYHLELYKNPSLTSKNCGHSLRELEVSYTNLTTEAAAREWFSIMP